MAMKKREQAKSFSRGQRFLISLNVLAMIVIALSLFLGVCYLAHLPEFRTRIDLTRENAFTLTPQTLDVLDAMDEELQVISLFHRPFQMDLTGRQVVEKKVGDYANKLLEEYVIRSEGKIALEILDRDLDNLRVKELDDTLGLDQGNVILFLCGNNRRDLFPSDLARIDAGGVDPMTNVVQPAKVRAYNTEAAITSAILSVSEEAKPKAYFTTGRREANIQDRSAEGLFFPVEALKRINFEVEELKLYAEPVVPEDCAVLVIPGPKEDFGDSELAAIQSYLYGGGRLFLALSPQSSASLEPILEAFNIGLNRAITCQESLVSQKDRFLKAVISTRGLSEESRITRSLAEDKLFGRFSKAGAVNRSADDLRVETLVWSPSDSWGDARESEAEGNYFYDSDSEVMGARSLAVSCEGEGTLEGAKMVFFADTYFYTNRAVREGSANALLFLNAINWLTERDYLLNIPPKLASESRIELYKDEYTQIAWFSLLVIPGAAAILGFLVWWFRRR